VSTASLTQAISRNLQWSAVKLHLKQNAENNPVIMYVYALIYTNVTDLLQENTCRPICYKRVSVTEISSICQRHQNIYEET